MTWHWPAAIVLARLVLAVLAQALVAGVYALQGDPTPWEAAAPWWVVYGTLIDVGCLALVAWLLRREGIRLRDLIDLQRERIGRDLLLGLGFIAISLVLFLAGGVLGPFVYGTAEVPTPFGELPLWGALYGVLIWPVLWAIAEDVTYLGYALPRLEVASRRAWLAVAVVTFGWAIQHIALPVVPDWRWVLYRFVSTIPIAVGLSILYLRTRRLMPFIIAHWALDALVVLMLVLLPLLAP
jgi:membrane protease YdiL (CAAX protease family)